MTTPDAAVERILSASTHYDVLELVSGTGALVPAAAVRRKYKELAIRVHPDKNRAGGAADAFKRLSEAYECLVDERSQRVYYQATLARSSHGQQNKRKPPPPPPPPPTAPYFPKKQRAKKRPPPPPPPPSSSVPPPTPRRWRSPEEVWAQFQREEEEQARREFQERGFERDYDATDRKKRRRDDAESPPREPHSEDEAEKTDATHLHGVETRAQDWAAWQGSRTPVEQPSAGSTKTSTTTTAAVTAACCLLCRRKFPFAAALTRHEQLSALHKENLARKDEPASTRSSASQ